MQSTKPPPIRNKIDLADPTHVRAWTRRLGISADALKTVIEKVGNASAAVAKEVELERAAKQKQAAPKQPTKDAALAT
jgi:3-oxoacyl-[acyl-carrier-protein] synthase III